jgi:hypothetical protein
MKQELFLFTVPNGKTYKVVDTGKGGFEIWSKQINGEFVYITKSANMTGVKNFLRTSGYKGH